MNSFQFIRFLKECKIVRSPTEGPSSEGSLLAKEADLIYTQLTHHNSFQPQDLLALKKKSYQKIPTQNFIDFKGFLKGIELIVLKLYPQMSLKKGLDSLFFLKISKNFFKKAEHQK